MPEPSEIFVPAVAVPPIVEARLAAGWTLLEVAGFRVSEGDTSPDPALVTDLGADGTTDPVVAVTSTAAWPSAPDLFARVRFAPPA